MSFHSFVQSTKKEESILNILNGLITVVLVFTLCLLMSASFAQTTIVMDWALDEESIKTAVLLHKADYCSRITVVPVQTNAY